MGVGRETTASTSSGLLMARAYLMGVGRETTAAGRGQRGNPGAYLMGVGRETTAGKSAFPPWWNRFDPMRPRPISGAYSKTTEAISRKYAPGSYSRSVAIAAGPR